MKRIGIVLWGALAATGVLARPARAAEPEPEHGGAAALEAALQEADRRFVAGDLTGALAVLEPACAGSERAECAFSLGAIHHGLGHCPEALASYRRYRAVAPGGEQIDVVTAALEEVEGRCGDPAPTEPQGAAASVSPVGDARPNAMRPAPEPSTLPAPPALALAAPPASPSMTSQLMVGSFVLSGAAGVGTVVFGVLAAQSAHDCGQARAYTEDFRSECEEDGPRYQGLWKGMALASASFLGIGVTLWWLDSSSTATVGVSGASTPVLNYRREF